MSDHRRLNPQQREAVETLRGPVLILAGAGTGKTRVITHRIAHLIACGVAPGHILGVTFTNKAAREMLERVRELLPRRPAEGKTRSEERPTICTFHSLCVRILRQHIERLGYKRNFVIYDEAEQLAAIRKILSHLSARGEKTDPHAILSWLSRYRNGGERAVASADPGVRAMAEHVASRYESALRACNAVDFDDLILLTLRLFREHPDALAACRERYRYVLVDEYQDTNAAQFELVHALTREHRNLCVVGDDDQSIYGWRGAEIANLLDLERHYPEVKVITLEQNYRSTTTILKAANAVIRHNARRRAKQLWSDQGAGAKLTLFSFANDDEEAASVVREIENARLARRATWQDQAVLFRTNGQSRPLETALRNAGVRYRLIGGQSFFDRREVRDFLAYLKLMLNPADDISLLRIANVPARGLSEATMQRLLAASQERKSSVFDVMKNPVVLAGFPVRSRESIERFVAWVEATAGRLETPVHGTAGALSAWADGFLEEIGYYQELRRGEKDAEAAENRVRNLKDLVGSLGGPASGQEPAVGRPGQGPKHRHAEAGETAAPHNSEDRSLRARLERFLEEVTLDAEREEEEPGVGDAVTLITMHSCKGLEFPHVFIVGLEEGLLPHTRSKAEGTLDEERRLFYVAITRARQTLKLSHCATRRKYGQLTPCHPSQFLKELPEELVERAEDRPKQPVTTEAGKEWFAQMRARLAAAKG
ncbi:MAG: UvrD-helicase domain-containing protein [Verrucomicrobia bacterium]|nr:UvrD-helicase domain-containing protein [Verrucomicrobiota bacterium]